MVSYEVAIGFVLISVVLWSGTFNLSGIVMAQQNGPISTSTASWINPLLFPMAVMFFISSLAETQRAPFDLTEAEERTRRRLSDRVFQLDELRAVSGSANTPTSS